MLKTLSMYKVSDGTAATGMDVDIRSNWVHCSPKSKISIQISWGTGPTGTFSLQFNNSANPTSSAVATNYPALAMIASPTQPSGSADNTIISVDSIGDHFRVYYDATSGGSGVLPVVEVSIDQ